MEPALKHWIDAFLQEENRVYRASILADDQEHGRARQAFLARHVGDASRFDAYLPYFDRAQRERPGIRAQAEASAPRILSIVLGHRSSDGQATHRCHVSGYHPFPPGRASWQEGLFVRDTGAGLRLVAVYAPCDRCEYTGQAGRFRCHSCDGTRWVHQYGDDLDLRALGAVVATDRLAPPFRKTHLADYESEGGLPPVDLPVDPNAAG